MKEASSEAWPALRSLFGPLTVSRVHRESEE